MNNSEYWDKLARRRIELRHNSNINWQLEWENEDPEVVFADLVIGYAKEAEMVLDVGCGEGQMSREIAGFAKTVVGVDLSKTALDEAAGLSPEYYVQADASKLPFVSEVFDLIYSHRGPGSESMESLAEIRRVMKPGTVLLALAIGELHRIETQEIFGRGLKWPPAKPLRFAIPEKLASAGLEMISFSEYYAMCHYPDIQSYTARLEADSIIPDFDAQKDSAFLHQIERKLTTSRGISETEHVALFAALKPA